MAAAKTVYHYLLAWLGDLIYRRPSRKIFVLGVTGTKGKTTVLELIAFILERAGKKTAVSSSLRYLHSAMTMPGRFFLQRFLRQAVKNSCDYALIEVTSEGVRQHRHRFINWDGAMFLNLAPEHIEAHGSFEKYRKAKLDFFRHHSGKIKTFFINKDDSNARYFIDAARDGQVVLYGKSDLPSQLPGEFNQYNISAAAAFARSQGIDEEVIKKAVAEFPGVPGRMEFIQRQPFAVVIDYAHTPDSLREVYRTLRSKSANPESAMRDPKLICVLGAAGGGRDKWKRPEMGKIASQYCDAVVLTNEDSYDETPEEIIFQIENGLANHKNYFKIIDRREAIKKAIGLARPGDMVVVTGKGNESWIHLKKGKKIPWSDRGVVLELL